MKKNDFKHGKVQNKYIFKVGPLACTKLLYVYTFVQEYSMKIIFSAYIFLNGSYQLMIILLFFHYKGLKEDLSISNINTGEIFVSS